MCLGLWWTEQRALYNYGYIGKVWNFLMSTTNCSYSTMIIDFEKAWMALKSYILHERQKFKQHPISSETREIENCFDEIARFPPCEFSTNEDLRIMFYDYCVSFSSLCYYGCVRCCSFNASYIAVFRVPCNAITLLMTFQRAEHFWMWNRFFPCNRYSESSIVPVHNNLDCKAPNNYIPQFISIDRKESATRVSYTCKVSL